jgi:hypothetical protein
LPNQIVTGSIVDGFASAKVSFVHGRDTIESLILLTLFYDQRPNNAIRAYVFAGSQRPKPGYKWLGMSLDFQISSQKKDEPPNLNMFDSSRSSRLFTKTVWDRL